MNVYLSKTSTFAALRNPVYRKLWFAILLSGTCVAAQDTAATWTMNMLGSSTFLLSLISTVASLPFFLFTLPAGALADMVNRRKLLCIMNLWLACGAVLLAILGSCQLLNPYVLLFCVFLIGVGFAFHAPAWSAIVPDLVTDEELPSAAALGGLQLHVLASRRGFDAFLYLRHRDDGAFLHWVSTAARPSDKGRTGDDQQSLALVRRRRRSRGTLLSLRQQGIGCAWYHCSTFSEHAHISVGSMCPRGTANVASGSLAKLS